MIVERMTKTHAFAFIQNQTGYGKRVVERAFEVLLEQNAITLYRSYNLRIAWSITREDLEKVIAYLNDVPPLTAEATEK